MMENVYDFKFQVIIELGYPCSRARFSFIWLIFFYVNYRGHDGYLY